MASSPSTSDASAEALSQHAIDLLVAGEPAHSADLFRQAIAADPEYLEAHHGLIRALAEANQFEQAVNAAQELVRLCSEDPLAYTSLSIALQRAGQVPEAEAAAGRARILEWKQQLASDPEA